MIKNHLKTLLDQNCILIKNNYKAENVEGHQWRTERRYDIYHRQQDYNIYLGARISHTFSDVLIGKMTALGDVGRHRPLVRCDHEEFEV